MDLKIIPIKKEKITAAEIPALAVASAPVTAPKKPFCAPFIAPLANKYPKPLMGTVAPAPANSTRYWYKPKPCKTTPDSINKTRIFPAVKSVKLITI